MSDKKKSAISLEYDPEKDHAPKLTAKGKGKIAERIIQVAKDNNIPIKEDEDLINILEILDVDSLIPFEAYSAVAEILAYVYDKDNNKKT